MALICISGALRTTPSVALNTFFFLPPLDLVDKLNARNTGARLAATNQRRDLGVGYSVLVQPILLTIV